MARSKIPPAVTFGIRVRTRRTLQGYSQEQLAELAGFHATYVSSVERGERNVTLTTILRLAKALKMDPAELVGGLKL